MRGRAGEGSEPAAGDGGQGPGTCWVGEARWMQAGQAKEDVRDLEM